ncbi:MAG: DUF58 domain-containing protein [Gemmatimonadaceae bacterium]
MSASALSASVVAAIDDLELAARLVVEGLRAGGHRSPFHGFSADFQQHRPYRSGDDLKYLDWKILARTDRLYSKQFRETTSMSVMLVLDSSGSMAFPEKGVSKFRYASVVAASLAYMIAAQGDAVGLMTTTGDRLTYLPAKGGRLHLRSLIAQIDKLRPAGSWQPDRVISRGAELLKRRGAMVVISDFYDDEEFTRRELRRVASRGHDVAALQLTSSAERRFPYRGDFEFEDVESGERRLVNATAIEAEYRTNIEAFLARWRTTSQADGIDYALMSIDEPPEQTLREYLLRRGAKHQSDNAARQFTK